MQGSQRMIWISVSHFSYASRYEIVTARPGGDPRSRVPKFKDLSCSSYLDGKGLAPGLSRVLACLRMIGIVSGEVPAEMSICQVHE